MGNFYLTVNMKDRIMSTSSVLLDQNFNANDVDLMVFEPSVLFPPPQFGGGGRWHGAKLVNMCGRNCERGLWEMKTLARNCQRNWGIVETVLKHGFFACQELPNAFQ